MQLAVAFSASSLFTGAGLMKAGFLAASATVGFMLSGKRDQKAQRLNDLKVSSSSYGKGIPLIYGTMRVAGNMIWSTDIEERKRYVGQGGKEKSAKKGKKGKAQEVYEYYGNFAIGLCQGPVEELLRVWCDSNLIYDKLNPDNEDIVEVGFSQGDTGGGKAGKGRKKNPEDSGRFSFRFYSGTENQLQDPYMVEKQGAANVPAYRGLCYIMFEEMPLRDFGNRIPTITCEVTVRKEQKTTLRYFTELDPRETGVSGSSSFADPCIGGHFDYERERFYAVARTRENRQVLRVYDFSRYREIKQVLFEDMAGPVYRYNPSSGLYDGEFVANHIPSALLGVGADGVLIFNGQGYANSQPIYFHDPNSLKPLYSFGVFSIGFSNSNTRIAMGIDARQILSIGIDGTLQRRSIVTSFDGQRYTFLENGQPDVYINQDPDNVLKNFSYTLPAFPSEVLGFFTFTSSDLIYVRFDTSESSPPNRGAKVDPRVIYRTVRGPRDWNDPSISPPALLITPQCVGIIETRYEEGSDASVYAIKLDFNDGKVIWRKKLADRAIGPDLYGTNRMPPTGIITGNKWSWYVRGNPARIVEVDFARESVREYSLPSSVPSPSKLQTYISSKSAIAMYMPQANKSFDPYGQTFTFAFLDRYIQQPATIEGIIVDVATRVGIDRSRLDFTDLEDESVTGFLVDNPTSARQIIEDLSDIYLFDVVESDYKLKFVSRGKSPVVVIPQDDLGILDEETNDYYKETRIQEIDLPERVSITHVNHKDDYQTNTAHFKRPSGPFPVLRTRDQLDLNLPIAMTPTEAKQIAQRILYSVWAERTTHDFKLPWQYIALDPTDVVRFEMNDGLILEDRLMKFDIGADFTIEASGVLQTPSTYSSTVVHEPPGGVIPLPKFGNPSVRPIILDIPYLTDTDVDTTQGFEFYWTVGALGPGFRYAIMESRQGSESFETIGQTVQDAVWGTVQGRVPDPPHGSFVEDDQSKITLLPSFDLSLNEDMVDWQSVPDDQWPSTINTVIIGKEVIHFKTVVENEDGSITISNLIRGARGTEGAAYNHKPFERWVLATGAIEQEAEDFSRVNQDQEFRTRSLGFLSTPSTVTEKLTGATSKPWAVNDVRRSPNGGNTRITWERRTRFNGSLRNGTSTVPLNEEVEEYEVYILPSTDAFNSFDPDNSSTYTSAFLGLTSRSLTIPGDPSVIYAVIYQVSADVGRGFPKMVTLQKNLISST